MRSVLDHGRRGLATDLKSLSPQQLSNSLTSIIQLNIKDRQVCDRFAREMMRRDLKTFPFPHLVSMAKSLAILNHPNEQVSFSIAREALHRFGKVPLPAPTLIDLMWAFAATDMLKNTAVNALFHLKYPVQAHPPSNPALAASQLLEIQLAWGQRLGQSSTVSETHLLASLLAPNGWVQTQLAETQAKRQVSEQCKLAGEMLQDKYPNIEVGGTVLNGLPTDLVIKSKRTVIQMYDSADFFRDGVNMTGHALFIQRLLLRANFRIYRLSKNEFALLTPEAQKTQIQHLIHLIEEETPSQL